MKNRIALVLSQYLDKCDQPEAELHLLQCEPVAKLTNNRTTREIRLATGELLTRY